MVSSRDQLIDYCKRKLGWPVLPNLYLDEDQIQDRIDEALQYYQEFNMDGVQRTYTKHELTDDDITNQYIAISDNISAVGKIFPLNDLTRSTLFDVRYQMRLNDLFTFTSASYVNYVLTQQHIRMLDMMFVGETPIRFNRNTNKLFLDWDWETKHAGMFIIIDGTVVIDPNEYPKMWNDRMLKKLATYYLKRQQATNIMRYSGMQLPGGVTINGPALYAQAEEEIEKVEQQIIDAFQEPPLPAIG